MPHSGRAAESISVLPERKKQVTAKAYSLTYEGYWRERNKSGIPARSGVYSVYACRYSTVNNTVSIRKLIYIGESANVRDRIDGHERTANWRRHLQPGEELCFNFAPISVDRERVEAALINHHKPPENDEYKHSFPYPQTTVSTSGRNEKLTARFTVYPSRRGAVGF